MSRRFLSAGGVVLLVAIAGAHRSTATVDPIVEWSSAASAAAAATGMSPFRTPVTLALLHLAMYDAFEAVTGHREPYAIRPPLERPASAAAAAIESGFRVLLTEFPGARATLDAEY
jgi:hypothetical protein